MKTPNAQHSYQLFTSIKNFNLLRRPLKNVDENEKEILKQ